MCKDEDKSGSFFGKKVICTMSFFVFARKEKLPPDPRKTPTLDGRDVSNGNGARV
jgi:hypothetical protein